MWRDSMRPLRLFIIDVGALVPLLIWLLHWDSLLLFEFAVGGVLLFAGLSYVGIGLMAFVRLLRRLAVGAVRPAIPRHRRRRFI